VHVVGNLTAPTALTWLGDSLYVGSNTAVGKGEITVFEGFNGTSFAHRHVLIENLPVGSHTIGSIVQGPEGRLFVGLGALSDASGPPGGVQSFPANGGTRRVEATGLRTAFGLAFWGHKLVVTETGPEHVLKRGDALYAFEPGGPVVNFGFPECYGQGGTACAKFPAPLTTFPAHSTPTGVAVKGDDAFVADNGSAVPQVSAPSEIERVQLSSGQKSTFWRSPVNHNLVGVAIGPEGDLFATLFATGQVVRFKL